MLFYLLKRLLWIIPTLWFITSVVFILSKLIPENILFSDENLQKSDVNIRIYKQYLDRTGQNLPLFYVNLKTLAEPDTLYRIFPEQDLTFARQMVLRYGNWPAIANYLLQLRYLQADVFYIKSMPEEKKRLNQQLENLWKVSTSQQTRRVFNQLKTTAGQLPENRLLITSLKKAESAFDKVVETQSSYRNLIPAIQWHGTQNQYHLWMMELIKGSLGASYRDARPVTGIIGEAMYGTWLLSLLTILIIFLTAILLNLFIGHEDYKRWQKPLLNLLFILDTVPVFLLALLLLIFMAANDSLSLFPVYGMGNTSADSPWLSTVGTQLYHMFLPVLCLTAGNLPYITTQLHQAMQETGTADFITTARAKGVVEWRIVGKHTLRNALLPLITLFSGFLPALLGGALVIEVIFAIPGMGSLLIDAILARDFPLILGIVLVLAFVKLISHIAADVLYYLADPRIRF